MSPQPQIPRDSNAYKQGPTYKPTQQPWSSSSGTSGTPVGPTAPPSKYQPVTSMPRDQHYIQYQPRPHDNPISPTPNQSQPQPVAQPYQQGPQTNPMDPNYDFIMNPNQAPRKMSLPGMGASKGIKIALMSGGILLLLIVGSAVKGVITKDTVLPAYLSVAQDQQEIVRLSTAALEVDDLSGANRNFAATAQLAVTSSKADLLALLAQSKKKVDPKQLALKANPATDERLTTAAAASTYNQTFKEVMQEHVNNYMTDLQATYQKSKSKTSQDILDNQYTQAQLLSTMLSSSGQTGD